MRKKGLLFVASVAIFALGGIGLAQAGPTMAGSTKDASGDLSCGDQGAIADVLIFTVYGNTSDDQTEVEACNDSGAANSQGRLVLRVNHNADQPGARLSLDSDADQQPPDICCGYINVQVGAEGTGLWCAPGGGAPGDGYGRPWSDPGHRGPTDPGCIPVVGDELP